MKIYVILDKKTNSFWKHKAKQSWISKGAAKTALMSAELYAVTKDRRKGLEEMYIDPLCPTSKEYKKTYLTFKDQFRYVCLEMI